ncbi:uncharacterized protein LOC128518452 isoform X2 [Clarias gariepinus]|uniref:uncharacterized protein LOC128518452 isoform X2 n=1 Tax=Clarias gariepinus TaxID=13013 RepID=UPI00234D72BF|nr:uncharacterized protein LOC128518452 isoform X2 [Clarias gariepinus]
MMHSEQGFQSQLFKSMQTYLCNPDRVQPIIGLRSVIELCTATKPPMYLCEVCIVRANMTDIKTHITGSLHRYSYIVLHLHEDIYKEMISQPILDVLAQVKQIQQTQTNVTEFQLPFCRTTTKETHFNDDYSNYYGDLYQVTPSCTTPPSLMSYATVSSKMSNETQNQFKTQNQVQFWFPAQFLCPDRDTSAQGSVISPIQASTQSLPGYPLPNCFSNLNPTAAFSSIPAAGAFQTCNPINDSMQNVTVHEEKNAHSWENGFNAFECISTESPSSHTMQTTKPNFKRVAHCKNNSLTVTVTQKRNPEQGSKQDHLATLKMRSTGTHTPAIIWNEDHCQNNDYLTSEELYRDTDWVLNNRKVGHEEGQHPQPFTADDALFMYEHMDQYQQRNNYSEEDIFLLQKNNEDSPENYSGTQPLIGLNAVIKCQSLAGDPPSCCYLCQPCSLKVLESDIIQHLISPLHQINYINFQYPHLSNCHSGLQSLETIAMQLEQEEGRGQMKVRRLSACLFNEVLEQDFYCSMKELNLGKGLTEKTRLNQKAVKKTSRITQDYNTPLKRTAGLFDCDESAAIGKPLFCHKRAKKKGKKKARLSEPVFKVSLLLNEGPMLVNRIPPVKETVAPEIE